MQILRHSANRMDSFPPFLLLRDKPRNEKAPNGNRSAYTPVPEIPRLISGSRLLTVEATFRVTVLCAAVAPLIVCDAGFSEQVTYATGLEQENAIAPVNPNPGAAETVTVPEAPGAIEIA
jgi:hypothetical protein